MNRIQKIIAALPAAAKHPAATNKQAWDEYIDPDATTPFESVTEAERVVYIAALTVDECLLDGEMDELIRNTTPTPAPLLLLRSPSGHEVWATHSDGIYELYDSAACTGQCITDTYTLTQAMAEARAYIEELEAN